ncbi:patatin-like phospholipase family protein [Halosquirtibacter xylanolyticus]|uniref:patatin-like phospholipase family protein n=1 Tax=Halosquirtibacter xylanolyticus TaxID=3374599 RepID=UPI00374A5B80|nr:patatin-like phospholipase family protein [Prolixibacteraceae bacterium]
MSKLPLNPFNNIAISMSGGGYRATAFHLGTLAYLSTILWEDKSLLERIRILSTVSGGTFTGVKYATTIKNGGTIKDCYNDLVSQMRQVDLVTDALKYLADDTQWPSTKQRTLINAFASVYHERFESEYLGKLWDDHPNIHLKEISFNATEFNFAIPFRFQKSEKTKDENGNYTYGYIGNKKVQIPLEMAKEIRLADIIAASSCFPLGFEPINFPDDFIDNQSQYLNDPTLLPTTTYNGDPIAYPIGIMDGGINDNQGIDAVWWAEKRMSRYPEELKEYTSDDDKSVDLYIISDVSSPYIERFIRSENKSFSFIGNCSFRNIRRIGLGLIGLSVFMIISALFCSQVLSVMLSTFIATITLIMGAVALSISNGFVGLTKRLGVPEYFTERLKPFDTLNFNTYVNLILNRANSVKTLVANVFMKRIRGGNYSKIYSDETWRPRLIMNAIYELCPKRVNKRKRYYANNLSKELLEPSQKILDVSQKAKRMKTTLWFTEEELIGDQNMLNTLIACGQYTICFNLLEHIERDIMGDEELFKTYSHELRSKISTLHDTLKTDWKHYNENPYFMVEQWRS